MTEHIRPGSRGDRGVENWAYSVSSETFRGALTEARRADVRVREATTPPEDLPDNARYFLTPDLRSGFGVTAEGDLIGLFTTVRGRGRGLVTQAVGYGARALDCFDGFLPGFYAELGWVETHREANWTPGEPDIVYMSV